MSKVKVLLADDHPLIREGFKSLLGKNEQIDVIGEAGNGSELLDKARLLSPHIVLADINMPVLTGLEAMKQLAEDRPEIKFIVLTMHEEREYVVNALKLGAFGYLFKNVEREELEKAILKVHAGEKYFSPKVANLLAESVARPIAQVEELTPREHEVLRLVAEGLSTKLIADKLNISIRTVESHRINMLKKMDVNNTAELITKAMKLGTLDT